MPNITFRKIEDKYLVSWRKTNPDYVEPSSYKGGAPAFYNSTKDNPTIRAESISDEDNLNDTVLRAVKESLDVPDNCADYY